MALIRQCSDDSGIDTAGEDTDDDRLGDRGRRTSMKTLRQDVRDTIRRKRQQMSPSRRALSPVFTDNVAEQKPNGSLGRRQSFTRSRSPHIRGLSNSSHGAHPQVGSPVPFVRHRSLPALHTFLPAKVLASLPIPFRGTFWTFSMDARSLAESLLLLGSLVYTNWKLSSAFKLLDISDPSISLGMADITFSD